MYFVRHSKFCFCYHADNADKSSAKKISEKAEEKLKLPQLLNNARNSIAAKHFLTGKSLVKYIYTFLSNSYSNRCLEFLILELLLKKHFCIKNLFIITLPI